MANNNNQQQPRYSVDNLLRHVSNEIDAIDNYNGPLLVQLDDDVAPEGLIYDKFLKEQLFSSLTNFGNFTVCNMFQLMLPLIALAARRGPKPKSTHMDCMLIYLVWLKGGSEVDVLSKILGLKPNRLEDNIARIRPMINAMLKTKWWSNRERPHIDPQSQFPYVALLVDHHSSEVFRPKTSFDEAKIKIYAFKNEVAVSATAPYYCMFVQEKAVGSIHDYQDHKKNYASYLPYLSKTPTEHHLLPGDVAHQHLAIMLDKAYVGPEGDTPGLRRITPKKGQLIGAERAFNIEVSLKRVPIEQFFGRMYKLWGVQRGVYRWDHANFQMDFENMCLLTNEHIAESALFNVDRDFYSKFLAFRFDKIDKKEKKRAGQLKDYSQRRKTKLQRVDALVQNN